MEKSVVRYYVLCNKLKDIIRTGWKDWNVKKERVESVAEHVYGVQMLAIAMHSQYKYNLNLNKIILMLAIHELEEILIGDLTCFQISEQEKREIGHKAIEEVLKDLINKKDLKKLIVEFDERKTEEAKFAYHCDKLECDLQCKLYDEGNYVDMNDQDNNDTYHDEKVQDIIKRGEATWSGMWLEHDKSKFIDDPNFLSVWEYIKNNGIS